MRATDFSLLKEGRKSEESEEKSKKKSQKIGVRRFKSESGAESEGAPGDPDWVSVHGIESILSKYVYVFP